MDYTLFIDDVSYTGQVDGDFTHGNDELLIEGDKNAIELTAWSDLGYSIWECMAPEEFTTLKENLLTILNGILGNVGLGSILKLEDYHTVVGTQRNHQKVIEQTRSLTLADFAVNIELLCEKLSGYLGKEVRIYNPKLETEVITLRISRPQSLDINPLHRDAYLDYYRDTVNVWIPIAGCNELSSLPVIPQSHFWNEKAVLRTQAKAASINGLTYHVPGIIEGAAPLKAIRPNPAYGQALVFTPYLIHGSALNLNKDITRMALELRPCLL